MRTCGPAAPAPMGGNRCATGFPVPRSNGCLRVLCGIVNIVIPGLGVFVLSLNYRRYRPTYHQAYGWVSLLQFLLAFIVIGWIWAILNGLVIMVVGCARGDKEFGDAQEASPAPAGVKVVQ